MGLKRTTTRGTPVVLGVLFSILLSSAALAQSPFDDIPADAYYADAVQWLVDEGLTTGGVDGGFRPEDPVTRGETAVFMWRLAGQPAAPVHRFTDVTVGWQDDAIAWMADVGITQGSTPTTFDPDGIVTRGALSLFLHRLAGEPEAPPHSFTDVDDAVLQLPVSWIAASGISSGIAPGEFGPQVPVVRGQLAVFLQRLSDTGILEPAADPVLEPVPEEAPEATVATLGVNPTSPRVAERVQVSGTGFAPGSILLTVGDEVAGVVEANASGEFEVALPIPAVAAGTQPLVAVADGTVVASILLEVRAEAPRSYLLPIAFLVAALAAVGSWWWRQRGATPEPASDVDATEAADAVAVDTGRVRVSPEASDLFSISPVGPGTLDNLATLGGGLWASASVDFDGAGHAMVLTTSDRGQDWSVVADLGPGHIDAVVVSEHDAIAVGSRFVYEELGMTRKATMWHSNDLRSWMAIGLQGESFAEAAFDGVVGVGETLVAYGRNADGPALWSGSDRGWMARRMVGPIDTVAATAHGALLFGRNSEQRQGVALRSSDGNDWQANKHPSTALFGSSTVLAVVDFQGGLVAAGYDNLRGTAAIWVSDDGIQWHRSPMDFPDDTGIEHLVVADGSLVAVGTIRSTTSGARKTRIGVWTSRDAVDWDLADDGGLGVDGRVNSIAFGSPSVIIAGSRSVEAEAPPVPVVWRFFGVGLQTSAS
jgi:hypothetical protein